MEFNARDVILDDDALELPPPQKLKAPPHPKELGPLQKSKPPAMPTTSSPQLGSLQGKLPANQGQKGYPDSPRG